MNFIAATVELRSHSSDTVNAYGLEYCGAHACVPSGGGNSEVRLRVLCYNREGPKLDRFRGWKEGTRALITGQVMFNDDPSQPLDVVVTTIEPSVPKEMYCNQVVLGNAFFGSDEIKERKNGALAVKIGTSLDNSDVVTWLFMEANKALSKKLEKRIRKGRNICVQGYLREYRKDETESPYRAIVTSEFTTRQDRQKSNQDPAVGTQAAGYAEVDPQPDY